MKMSTASTYIIVETDFERQTWQMGIHHPWRICFKKRYCTSVSMLCLRALRRSKQLSVCHVAPNTQEFPHFLVPWNPDIMKPFKRLGKCVRYNGDFVIKGFATVVAVGLTPSCWGHSTYWLHICALCASLIDVSYLLDWSSTPVQPSQGLLSWPVQPLWCHGQTQTELQFQEPGRSAVDWWWPWVLWPRGDWGEWDGKMLLLPSLPRHLLWHHQWRWCISGDMWFDWTTIVTGVYECYNMAFDF